MPANQPPSPENFQPASQESIFNLLESIHRKQPYFMWSHFSSMDDGPDGGSGHFSSQSSEGQKVHLYLRTKPFEKSRDGVTASIMVSAVNDVGKTVPFSGKIYDFHPTDDGVDLRVFSEEEIHGFEKLKPSEPGGLDGADFFEEPRRRKAEQRRAGLGIVSEQDVVDLNVMVERAYPKNRIGILKRLIAMLTISP